MLVKKNHQKSSQPNQLQRKLFSNEALGSLKDEGLAREDVQDIINEAKTMKHEKTHFLKSLCHFNCLGSKEQNRQIRLQRKTAEHFDSHLDIRSFVSVHTNLRLLIWLLLSEDQRLLFNHHRERAMTQDRWKKGK